MALKSKTNAFKLFKAIEITIIAKTFYTDWHFIVSSNVNKKLFLKQKTTWSVAMLHYLAKSVFNGQASPTVVYSTICLNYYHLFPLRIHTCIALLLCTQNIFALYSQTVYSHSFSKLPYATSKYFSPTTLLRTIQVIFRSFLQIKSLKSQGSMHHIHFSILRNTRILREDWSII